MLRQEMETQGNFLFRYRGLFPVPIVVFGVGAFAWTHWHGAFPWFEPGGWGAFVCYGVSLFGLLIRSVVVGHVPAGTSGRNTQSQVAETVNRDGLYATVRHPLYFGNYFMWLGCILMTQSVSIAIIVSLVFALYYERIMFAEESFVAGKYGKMYTDWAADVPAFFPRLTRYRPSTRSLNLRKVFRQEVNGLLMLTLVFTLFALILEWESSSQDYAALSICMAAVLPMVLVLKVVTKKSRFFRVE